jgi:hypothetical protein
MAADLDCNHLQCKAARFLGPARQAPFEAKYLASDLRAFYCAVFIQDMKNLCDPPGWLSFRGGRETMD